MDLNRGIPDIEYDNLGNPRRITFTDNRSIEYVYSSDGTKLRTIHRGSGWLNAYVDSIDYVGNLILKNGQPEMYLFDGGYASFNNDTVNGWHYYISDYMGNNRMVVNSNGDIEQVTHYYPYGGVIGDISTNENVQKYKFEGKELDRSFGLDNYDIHARQYFAMAPMWDRIDSLAEKLPGVSPYVFCNGDPVNLVDRDGKCVETLWDIANVAMDVKSAYDNFSNGNTRAGLVDVGAGIVDGLATVLPLVPAGAGTALKVARGADKASDVVQAINKEAKVSKAKMAMERGRAAEKKVISEMGETKNTKRFSAPIDGEEITTIPDVVTKDAFYEIKDVKYLTNTKQLRAERVSAAKSEKKFLIIIGEKTRFQKKYLLKK